MQNPQQPAARRAARSRLPPGPPHLHTKLKGRILANYVLERTDGSFSPGLSFPRFAPPPFHPVSFDLLSLRFSGALLGLESECFYFFCLAPQPASSPWEPRHLGLPPLGFVRLPVSLPLFSISVLFLPLGTQTQIRKNALVIGVSRRSSTAEESVARWVFPGLNQTV